MGGLVVLWGICVTLYVKSESMMHGVCVRVRAGVCVHCERDTGQQERTLTRQTGHRRLWIRAKHSWHVYIWPQSTRRASRGPSQQMMQSSSSSVVEVVDSVVDSVVDLGVDLGVGP